MTLLSVGRLSNTESDGSLGHGTGRPHDSHPLVRSSRQLAALDRRFRFQTAVVDSGWWLPLSRVHDPDSILRQLDTLGADRRSMHTVAAAQLSASLACTVVRPMMALLYLHRRVPQLDPDHVHVRAPGGGRFDTLALEPRVLTARGDDPASSHPDVRTVASTAMLIDCAGERIANALTPTLQTIHEQGRYGLRQLWGAVLDMIGATSLLTARLGGLDQQRVWADSQRLCEVVKLRCEQPRVHQPKPMDVAWSGGQALYTVKGTCCLRYREHGLRAGDEQHSDAYCKTCPFLADDARRARCGEQMERETARSGR